MRKRIFSVNTGKINNCFSKYAHYPQKKFPLKKKTEKNKITKDFKIGNNNYNKKNNYFQNLKYALKSKKIKEKKNNLNLKKIEKKIWRPNNILKNSTFQPFPKYLPNGKKKNYNKKKIIQNIWKPTDKFNTKICPSILFNNRN